MHLIAMSVSYFYYQDVLHEPGQGTSSKLTGDHNPDAKENDFASYTQSTTYRCFLVTRVKIPGSALQTLA